MSKIITTKELATIVNDLLLQPEVVGELEESTVYQEFLEDIATVVADHCGGDVVYVSSPDFDEEEVKDAGLDTRTYGDCYAWCVHIQGNDSLPDPEKNIWTYHGFDPDGELFPGAEEVTKLTEEQ